MNEMKKHTVTYCENKHDPNEKANVACAQPHSSVVDEVVVVLPDRHNSLLNRGNLFSSLA